VSQPERCSDASAEAGEPLAGTAAHVENWLLVELRGTWPRDVSDVVSAGGPGTEALRSWLGATPASRLLFVRRPGARPGGVRAFVVRAAPHEEEVRRFELEGLADLDALDLERGGEVVDGPLVLVCGHGARDACCALRGNAVYAALAPHAGEEELWISTHQAGHRFAANVLLLPSGIQLGRLDPGSAPEAVNAARLGRIPLGHLRGLTFHPPHVQAADAAVREHTRLAGVRDLVLVADDGTIVAFETRDGRAFRVAVDEVAGAVVPPSCGAAPEAQRAFSPRLLRAT
jgi:hypothetical protein